MDQCQCGHDARTLEQLDSLIANSRLTTCRRSRKPPRRREIFVASAHMIAETVKFFPREPNGPALTFAGEAARDGITTL